MTSPPPLDLISLAAAERERRRRARLRAFPSYGEWLPLVSPTWDWSYAWLRYVQGFYDRVTAGEIRKLAVFAPPQHGKSEGGTVRYPVYRLERDPTVRCIVVTHSQKLANKFSRKSRALANQRLTLASDKKAVAEWSTPQGGGITAVGVGGAIAGNPAELLFIDDPVRNREAANSLVIRDKVWDWYIEDVITRVQNAGATILQMTRWHEDDLAGRILDSEDGPNWTVVRLPAIAEENDPLGRAPGAALCPERFTIDTLRERERLMRTAFQALYQQRPTAKEGGLFQRAWFKPVDLPAPLPALTRVRHWDLAATDGDGDWTVGVRIARTATAPQFWIEDVARFRLGPAERDKRIRAVAESDPKGTKFSFEQEPGSGGKAQAHAMVRLLAGFTVTFDTATGSKEVRAEPLASQFGADNVRLARGKWNAGYIAELVEFPNSKHDDQVDASSGAFNKLAGSRRVEVT